MNSSEWSRTGRRTSPTWEASWVSADWVCSGRSRSWEFRGSGSLVIACQHCSAPVDEDSIPVSHRSIHGSARGSYICVSTTVKHDIERHGIALTGSVTLLPNWITGERPEPRQAYYESGHLRVMSAGSVNRDKGTDILIEAAARLRSLGVKNFSVDVYGKIGDPSLTHLIREHGLLREIVRLMGPRPHAELTALYGSYDILVFPTAEREPFGMVPLEASARGCVPIITSRCGVSEWLVHGVHCRESVSFARGVRPRSPRRRDGQDSPGPDRPTSRRGLLARVSPGCDRAENRGSPCRSALPGRRADHARAGRQALSNGEDGRATRRGSRRGGNGSLTLKSRGRPARMDSFPFPPRESKESNACGSWS